MKHWIGIHLDLVNPVDSLRVADKFGANVVQFFVHVNKPYSQSDADKFVKYLTKNKMKAIIHSSYTHNIARYWDRYSWWVKSIENEIRRADQLRVESVVLHLGKKLELSVEEAYNNMLTFLVMIHDKTKELAHVKILLETPSGQGSELCWGLEDLAVFYGKIKSSPLVSLRNRIGLCLDTCHIHSAGYDLGSKQSVRKYLDRFDGLIGVENVRLVHLNNSTTKLGSRVDRHANLKKGTIGIEGLKYFFLYFRQFGVPIVLETPGDEIKRDLKFLVEF